MSTHNFTPHIFWIALVYYNKACNQAIGIFRAVGSKSDGLYFKLNILIILKLKSLLKPIHPISIQRF